MRLLFLISFSLFFTTSLSAQDTLLLNAYFETHDSSLSSTDERRLGLYATDVANGTLHEVHLYGYSSTTMGETQDTALAKARIKAVQRLLENNGITLNKITAHIMGYPVLPDPNFETPDEDARKVRLVIIYEEPPKIYGTEGGWSKDFKE